MGCGSIQKIHEPMKTGLSNRKPDQNSKSKSKEFSPRKNSAVEKGHSKKDPVYIDTQANVEVAVKVIEAKPYVYVPYLHIEQNVLYQKRVM